MRRKVTCTPATEVGALIALLVAQLDLADVVLLDAPAAQAADLAEAGDVLGFQPRVTAGGWEDAAGSDLVLLAVVDDATGAEVARRCSGAVVVVATEDATGDVERLLDETLFPRGRLLGVGGDGPYERAARTVALADAILRDRRDRLLRGAVLCRGDSQDVEERSVRVGAAGVVEIVQPAPFEG
jgi:hypothetical protein